MNIMKTMFLLAALTGFVMTVAYFYGGREMAYVALAICGVMNFFTYWFSDKIVLRMHRARQVGPHDSPKLYGMVERLARKARMPMPKVYIIPTQSPNAFATGRSPSHAAVAATEGIIKLLSDDELEGVMAHELAHVKNRDTLISTVAATLGGAVGFIMRMFLYGGGDGRSRNNNGGAALVGAILAMIIAPMIAMMIQMTISRGREYIADRDGARICGNPRALAGALERLHTGVAAKPMPEGIGSRETAHMFIVSSLGSRSRGGASLASTIFSTHPPMEERVRRLRAMKV